VFYNSLALNRTSIARVHINVANVEVQDPNGQVIASQVDPFFVGNDVSSSVFKVWQITFSLSFFFVCCNPRRFLSAEFVTVFCLQSSVTGCWMVGWASGLSVCMLTVMI